MSENGADVSWNDVGKVLEDERSSVEDIQTDLARNNKGNICQSIDNCMTVFQRDPLLKGAIRKNELSGKIDIVGNLGWERTSSSLTDTDVYQLHWYLEKEYGLKNERNINKAMNIAASENRYHPIREYLEQLVWDGKYRIGRLLPKYLGAEEDAYTREIMQLLMLAAIHRVYEPGCKYEIMVCLVGGQGAGKSTFFRFLAINDEWFSDDLKRMDDDNVYGKKFHPVKKYAIDLADMTPSNRDKWLPSTRKWYLKIEGLYRDFIEKEAVKKDFQLSQEYCMILTIRDPEHTAPVYDEVTQQLTNRNFIHHDVRVRNVVHVTNE